jgi:hypothetical protein
MCLPNSTFKGPVVGECVVFKMQEGH